MHTSLPKFVNEINHKVFDRLKIAKRFSLIIVSVIAATVLLAWLIPPVGLALPEIWSQMKANTALVILFSTGSLILVQSENRLKRVISQLLALGMVLLSGFALMGHMAGMNFPIDTFIAADIHSDMPGRMSFQTAGFYFIFGISLLLLSTLNKRWHQLIDSLSLILVAIVLIILAGYSFQVADLFGQSSQTLTSPHTLLSSALLIFSLITTRMQQGFFAIFIGSGIGSQLVRMATPFIVLLPFTISSITAYAAHLQWIDFNYATALNTAIIIIILLLFLVFMANKINLTMEALAGSQQQNSLLLHSASEGILGLNLQGRATFVNTAACQMLGYEADELIGEPIHALIHHSHADSTPYHEDDCRMRTAFKDGQTHRVDDEVLWRKDGSPFAVEYASTPLYKNTEVIGAVVIFNDATERRKAEQLKDEFISVVSHELRTPLTSVKAAILMVLSGKTGVLPKKVESMLTIAANNSERLELLINDLLDINKLKVTKSTFTTIDINGLISQAITSNQSYAEKYGVTCVWQPSTEKNVLVMGDELRLMQALLNLLSNAIKFSPPDKPVTISTHRDDKSVWISVSDSGPGIPFNYQDKVFDKFFQVDSSDTRQKGGTGLGLPITQKIIEKHSGKISLTSQPGEGTTFCIELPIKSDEN
jgi:PAS domain S-box-containing protein